MLAFAICGSTRNTALGSLREFLVFEVFGMSEFQHHIPKQERVLAVVEPPRRRHVRLFGMIELPGGRKQGDTSRRDGQAVIA